MAGLHNGAVDTFNVSAIFGSLNDAAKFSNYYVNFSGQVQPASAPAAALYSTQLIA